MDIDFSALSAYQRYKLMASLIVPRPIALVSTLFCVSIVTFLVVNVLPGDPAEIILGTEGSSEALVALREKLGLGPDENGENIVAYTMRHTSATRATACGVRDKLLAELMGQTNTATTQRYQHLQAEHLADAIRRVNGRKKAQ